VGINDAVDWRADLGGGTTVALVRAGTFRTDSGAIFGPVPWILWRPWPRVSSTPTAGCTRPSTAC